MGGGRGVYLEIGNRLGKCLYRVVVNAFFHDVTNLIHRQTDRSRCTEHQTAYVNHSSKMMSVLAWPELESELAI